MKVQTDPNITIIHSCHSTKGGGFGIISHHVRPLVPVDEPSIWHLSCELCPRLPLPDNFGVAAPSLRHFSSVGSVVIFTVTVIVVAIGSEEVGGVVPKKPLVSLLERLTLNISVFASSLTIEVIIVVSRTVLVDSAATALKFDQSPLRLLGAGVVATTNDGDDPNVIVSALVVASGFAAAFIRLEAIVNLVASTVPLASSVRPRIPVNPLYGAGSAVCCCWFSDCSGCGDLAPGPRIDWYNPIILLISRRLGLNGVAACSPVLTGSCRRSP
jgi:hypothetical protein